MGHKYLKDAGFDKYAWGDTLPKNDHRRPQWTKDRKVYGFDERETWSLKDRSLCWLYEHIKMYQEISDINLDHWQFDINGTEMTHRQVLNKILEDIEVYFNVNGSFIKKYGEDNVLWWNTQPKLAKEIWDLWGTVFPAMWW